MYSLQEKDVHRLISACRYYMSQTSSEKLYEEYSRILDKLENYISQNFPETLRG